MRENRTDLGSPWDDVEGGLSAEVRTLRHGQTLRPTGTGEVPVVGFAPDGSFVALLTDSGDTARSLLVVPTD